MKYLCEVCGKESKSYLEIVQCEDQHKIEKRLKNMPSNAVKCPTCDGKGSYYGSDECDVRSCYACDGVGFVIPVKTVTTSYQKIEKNKR